LQNVEDILKIIKDQRLNVLEISRKSGIPSSRIYKWLDGKGNPKTEDSEKLQNWAVSNLEEVPRENKSVKDDRIPEEKSTVLNEGQTEYKRTNILEKIIHDLVSSSASQTRANEEQAKANRIQAEANERNERNKERMITMIESTAGADRYTLLETVATLTALRKYFEKFAGDLKNESPTTIN
jgi:hypothetical protein